MSRWTTGTTTGIRNTHERSTPGPLAVAEDLLGQLGGDDDALWPTDRWPPLRLDDGHRPGSDGGHGPVRYRVVDSDARSVRFDLTPATGFAGRHGFTVEPDGDGVRWRHVLEIDDPPALVRWIVVPLHDALLEDLLDAAEARMSGGAVRRRPFPLGVRLRRGLVSRRPSTGR